MNNMSKYIKRDRNMIDLRCGDCLEIMKDITKQRLLLTDIPYEEVNKKERIMFRRELGKYEGRFDTKREFLSWYLRVVN